MKKVFEMQNASAGVDQDCIAAYSADTQWMCELLKFQQLMCGFWSPILGAAVVERQHC